MAGMAPRRVTDAAAQALANARQSRRVAWFGSVSSSISVVTWRRDNSNRNAPTKASPAPVVSTTDTGNPRKQHVSGRVAVEHEIPLTRGAEGDEGQRGLCRGGPAEPRRVDAELAQRPLDAIAERIAPHLADKLCRSAESGDTGRHVGRRPAGHACKGVHVRQALPFFERHEVDKRLAEAEDRVHAAHHNLPGAGRPAAVRRG